MNTITINIIEFDENNNSIIVGFSHEELTNEIRLTFQISNFEKPNDMDRVLKEIAHTGISLVEATIKQEQLKKQQVLIENYKNIVGVRKTYNIPELQNYIQLLYSTNVTPENNAGDPSFQVIPETDM